MPETFSDPPVALAVFAHPDDIEFTCAGTLALLADRGWTIHYWNLADGSCGSLERGPEDSAAERWSEARIAAQILGATTHPPLFRDLEIFFNNANCRRVAAVLRRIQPNAVFTHAVRDYMEDHMETARLTQHALFSAPMPNYKTDPDVPPYDKPRVLYHTLPHGLHRPVDRQRAYPEFYVNIDGVINRKREALAAHLSQKEWLDKTQGMDAYLDTMAGFAKTLAKESGAGEYAEGFTRHLPIGLGPDAFTPIETALEDLVRFR